MNSACSPLEVRARDGEVCRRCATRDCVPACELFLFQGQKVGNIDCTFCLDCVQACPHGNVGLIGRMPVSELWDDRRRSTLGRLHGRTDFAFLAGVLVFASLLNAFGMVGPFGGFELALMKTLNVHAEWVALAFVFISGLALLPVALFGLVSLLTRLMVGRDEPIVAVATRFAFALVPLGFGMWAAHYGFHFLTGALTAIPVVQEFFADLGVPVLGTPRWDLGPIVPASWLLPIELILLEAGLLGSMITAYRIAEARYGHAGQATRASAPWIVLALLLFAVGVWLMLQPMEMRGTLSAG